jgi:hypothetical protein
MTLASWSGTTEEREHGWKRNKHQLPLQERTSTNASVAVAQNLVKIALPS